MGTARDSGRHRRARLRASVVNRQTAILTCGGPMVGYCGRAVRSGDLLRGRDNAGRVGRFFGPVAPVGVGGIGWYGAMEGWDYGGSGRRGCTSRFPGAIRRRRSTCMGDAGKRGPAGGVVVFCGSSSGTGSGRGGMGLGGASTFGQWFRTEGNGNAGVFVLAWCRGLGRYRSLSRRCAFVDVGSAHVASLVGISLWVGRASGASGISRRSPRGEDGSVSRAATTVCRRLDAGIALGGGVRSLATECGLVLASGGAGGDSSVAKKRQRVWGIALALVLLAANFPIAARAQSSHDTWAGIMPTESWT